MRSGGNTKWWRWFAWRPVFVPYENTRYATGGQWVWLEWLWKKWAIGLEGHAPTSLFTYRGGNDPPHPDEWG